MLDIDPNFCIWRIWFNISSKSNLPFNIFLATASASCLSIFSTAFSTKLTTSPLSNIRPAKRSAWNSSISSSFSPVPKNFIGAPDIIFIDKAAPALEDPSIRVNTKPLTPIFSLNSLATLQASWPINASATSNVSVGLDSFLTRATSSIKTSSICKRPAVSNIKTSYSPFWPTSKARLVISKGFSSLIIGRTSTSIWAPNWESCSCAAGRYTSKDAKSTLFFFLSFNAIFADVVVLPEPCKPTIKITAGGTALKFNDVSSLEPNILTSSS